MATTATTSRDPGRDRADGPSKAPKADLARILGAEAVRDDADTRRRHSGDIWAQAAETVELVIAPADLGGLSAAMAHLHAVGASVAPRGAGMSYTMGYAPADARTVSIDMARMDRILRIDADCMTVTVEAGCTWAALHAALAKQGLRTPFWGPMSGLTSTVGGGVAQLNAMLGAGHHGTTSESVVALTVVLADGTILRTGNTDGGSGPFYRHYGPDLTGLFCGDCGAFGVKAEITLRLMRAPAAEDYASFGFPEGGSLLAAMSEISRAGLAAEMCAFDPGLTRARLKRASLATDIKALGAVVGHQKSLLKGLTEAAKVAVAGRNFVEEDSFPLHVIAEGRCAAAVAHDMAEMRRIAARFGGTEIGNTIAKMIRSMPFPPLNSVLGPSGERWGSVHAVVSHGRAAPLLAALDALLDERRSRLDALGIVTGFLFTSLSTNALLIEPVMFWPGERLPMHAVAVEPALYAKLPVPTPSAEAAAEVRALRADMIALFADFGCGHFQIGRAYPHKAARDPAAWRLLETLKRAVDPDGRINPGVLGFSAPQAAE